MFNKFFKRLTENLSDVQKDENLQSEIKLTNVKKKEKIELIFIDDIVSPVLLRVITKSKNSNDEFLCFEFQRDSIKIYNLIEAKRAVGELCSYPHHKKPVRKQLLKKFIINQGKIIAREKYEHELLDFRIVKKGTDVKYTWWWLESWNLHSDGSAGWNSLGAYFNIEDVQNAEKILFFLKSVSSNQDMTFLEKLYVKYNSDLLSNKLNLINELDVDGNGVVDIAENNDFSKLLKTRQKLIVEFEKAEGKTYIHNFIKLSNYLNDNKNNIQGLFEFLKEESSKISNSDYDDFVGVLRNQINTFHLMLLASMNMIISLTDDDRITFYEIYETFDKLNVFSSNHEKEISERLKNIEVKINEVINSIHNMEINICNELYKLQFISEDISDSLKGLLIGLSEINSSIKMNNILTGIQTYQMYKVNLNTKVLR